MRFIVDQTLGGLAKWLRLCGFDTTQKLIRVQDPASLPAPDANTRILTRQTGLTDRYPRQDILVVTADHPEAQLAEVMARFNLAAADFKPLNRCSRCNQPLVAVSKDQVRGRVPEYVYQHQHQFYECPACHQVFWVGSHVAAICRRLQALSRPRPGRESSESPE
ncbi:MAG: Mut7-C RNAse domain-containing protein [Desulfobacca sp.]|nr:Mut7-C RNAse domain-containing protein [Desulfobacca sp.]